MRKQFHDTCQVSFQVTFEWLGARWRWYDEKLWTQGKFLCKMREEGSLFLQRNKYVCLCGVWRIKSVKACSWPFQCINRVLRRGSQALLDICPTYFKFSFFRSNWNKRTTSKRSPQFWNGFSGKLVYLLLSNQNNWLNGKHPWNSHINSVTATERLCNSRVKSVIIYAFTVWKSSMEMEWLGCQKFKVFHFHSKRRVIHNWWPMLFRMKRRFDERKGSKSEDEKRQRRICIWHVLRTNKNRHCSTQR